MRFGLVLFDGHTFDGMTYSHSQRTHCERVSFFARQDSSGSATSRRHFHQRIDEYRNAMNEMCTSSMATECVECYLVAPRLMLIQHKKKCQVENSKTIRATNNHG